MLPVEPNEALSPSERRTSDRKKLIVDVKFDGGDATGIANTRDIGVGGLYMTTNAQLESGTPISMRITVGGREVALEGVVAYIDPGQGVGVRFQNLSDEDKNLLVKELDLE
jgi:PilZ domain